MDSVNQEKNQSTRRGFGPSVRFAHFGDEDRHSGPSGNRYSSGGNNNETWWRRPAARRTEPGSGDFGPRSWGRAVPKKVLVVYGLERIAINCDQVFNLFCLYGNVAAVKILKAKQVLVELQDVEGAKRCVHHLNALRLDETNELSVKYSRHSFINESGTNNNLSDGTPVRKSYMKSALNRFSGKDTYVDQCRTTAPSKILHFYNAPLDVTATDIHKEVTDALGRTAAISSVVILPKKQPGAKCSSGLIVMSTVELAVKTICLSNHKAFKSTRSRFPFTTKLCFSKWSNIRRESTGSLKLLLSNTPRAPWLVHKSEHAVSAMEFPAPRATLQWNSDGTSWTQWEIRDVVTEAAYPAAGTIPRNQSARHVAISCLPNDERS